MTYTTFTTALLTASALLLTALPAAPALAQQDGAMHGGGQPNTPPSSQPRRPQGGVLDLEVVVNKVGEDWKKSPAVGEEVLLEVFAGEQLVRTYTEPVDDKGVASFKRLFRVQGARYAPVVVHDGVRYKGTPVAPTSANATSEITVYDKTYEDDNLVVTDLMTTVDVTEGYLVFMQMWTFSNAAPATFDVPNSTDPAYAEGLIIELPIKAEGIHANVVRGRADMAEARVVENKIFVDEPVPPAGEGGTGLRVQLRYSIKLLEPTFSYQQPLRYDVENMRVIATLTTNYAKHPRLDLSMTAPGFGDVGENRQMPGMRRDMEFLVARDGHAKAGGELQFTISGYPIEDPPWRWLALFGGLLLVVGVAAFGIKETNKGREGRSEEQLKRQALKDEREALYDALRDLDDRYFDGEITDRSYDIEVAALRERLALVLRRLSADEAVG